MPRGFRNAEKSEMSECANIGSDPKGCSGTLMVHTNDTPERCSDGGGSHFSLTAVWDGRPSGTSYNVYNYCGRHAFLHAARCHT